MELYGTLVQFVFVNFCINSSWWNCYQSSTNTETILSSMRRTALEQTCNQNLLKAYQPEIETGNQESWIWTEDLSGIPNPLILLLPPPWKLRILLFTVILCNFVILYLPTTCHQWIITNSLVFSGLEKQWFTSYNFKQWSSQNVWCNCYSGIWFCLWTMALS